MSFVNAGTHAAGTITVGTTNSYVPNWPTEMTEGDPIVIIAFPDTSADVVNVPSGYTPRSAGANSIKVFSKHAGPSETAPTITSSSTVQHECLVLRLPGYDLSTFSMFTGTASGGSAWSTPAGLPASVDNIFVYGGLATGGTSDWLSGDEPAITSLIWQGAGTSMWAGVGYDVLTASGTTGTRSPWDNTSGSKVTFSFTIAPVTAAATVDSYPATVRSGDTGVAYTTTGLSSVSGITIGSLAATSISDTAGDGTHSIPVLVDETAHELYGTRTVTITGTGGAPTTTVSFQPVAGTDFTTLSGTINATETGAVYAFSPAAVVNDQLVKPVALGIDAQANILGGPGVYTVWHIQASTKIARSYTLTLGSEEGMSAGLSSSSTLTASLSTAIRLSASCVSIADVTADLTHEVRFAATLSSQSSVPTAILTAQRRFAADMSSSSVLTASLTTNKVFDAALTSVSSVVASLTTQVRLSAALGSTSVLTAAFADTQNLGATLTSLSAVAAALTTQIRFQAALTAQSVLGAPLLTEKRFQASLVSIGTTTAALTTQKRFGAALSSMAVIQANLSGGTPVILDPVVTTLKCVNFATSGRALNTTSPTKPVAFMRARKL
jgi:hypothetical protein